MKKKNIFIILAVLFLVILLVFLLFFQEKKLDITSDKVTSLHTSLGEVDINKCGGLITYSDKDITESDLESDNRLCMAYHKLENNKKVEEIVKSNEENDNEIKICKVGENTTLATSDDKETECSYEIINKNDLSEAYSNLFGKNSPEDDSFYISSDKACFKEGEKYYCGNAETYKISLAPETTIYRIVDKAIEKLNGEIIIYDYFLKISDDKCYSKNNSEENKECSDSLKDKDLTKNKDIIDLVKKYGAIYKHTFKEDKNKNHYWFKSELK